LDWPELEIECLKLNLLEDIRCGKKDTSWEVDIHAGGGGRESFIEMKNEPL
jgi:hypothetical protein